MVGGEHSLGKSNLNSLLIPTSDHLQMKYIPIFSAPAAWAYPVLPGEAGGGIQRDLGLPSPPVPPHLLHT